MDVLRRLRWTVITLAALAAVGGCTPSDLTVTPTQSPPTVSPSPSVLAPTPTPTETWSPEQAAAIKAVEDYSSAFEEIAADPAAFTEDGMRDALERVSGENALDSTVAFLVSMKEREYTRQGSAVVLTTLATGVVDDGLGDEVHVTTCRDQTSVRIVDKDGGIVTGDEFAAPKYNLRQAAVRRPPGEETFRVFAFQTVQGECP